MSDIESIIVDAFEHRAEITPRNVDTLVKDAVMTAIEQLDRGEIRVAEKKDGDWVVNEWIKKAVLLSFRIEDNVYNESDLRGLTEQLDEIADLGLEVVSAFST